MESPRSLAFPLTSSIGTSVTRGSPGHIGMHLISLFMVPELAVYCEILMHILCIQLSLSNHRELVQDLSHTKTQLKSPILNGTGYA